MKDKSLKALVGEYASQAELARRFSTSKATMSQVLNYGFWPRTTGAQLKQQIEDFLVENGVAVAKARAAIRATAPDETSKKDPVYNNEKTAKIQAMEDTTVYRMQTLNEKARRAFMIFNNPFKEADTIDDVYLDNNYRFALESMYQTAKNNGFMALIGESGSGKSTLRRALVARCAAEDSKIIFACPYILAMTDSNKTGKRMQATSLAECILYSIDPHAKFQGSPEARFRKMHSALVMSHKAGNKHCVIIEEAHDLSADILKQLKRFLELENGMGRLLSVILIGQTELKFLLSETNSEVREVVQRCEIVDLEHLKDPCAYVYHRCARAGLKNSETLFPKEGIVELAKKLSGPTTHNGSGVSLAYPLSLGNLLIAGLNKAAELGDSGVTLDVVRAM